MIVLGALSIAATGWTSPTGFGGGGGGINPPSGDIGCTTAVPCVKGIGGAAIPTPLPTAATNATGVVPVFPGGATTAVMVNVYPSEPNDVPFRVDGTPPASQKYPPIPCTRQLTVPANFTSGAFPNASSQVWCITAPTLADTFTINMLNGAATTLVGTFTLTTTCNTGGTATFVATGGIACTAGQALQLVAPATLHAEANFVFNLATITP